METSLLTTFLEVAQRLHFGQAASHLQMTQPTLSHQIRRLEQEIGTPLFERTSRQVRLTAAGQALIPEARQVLAGVERAVLHCRTAADGEAGYLKVGSIGAALNSFTPHFVQRLREGVPGLTFQLTQLDSPLQLAALRTGELDLGIVRSADPATDIAVEDLFPESMVIALPASHPLCGTDVVTAADLRTEPFILWPRTASPLFRDQFVAYCAAAGFRPRIVMEGADIETQLGLVSAEIGISPQPASFASLRRRGVHFRPLSDAPESIVQLAWPASSPPRHLPALLEIAHNATEPTLRQLHDAGSR
jgi:DNA-binding transcriptional LysR family regulator